jgi:hypothetical protein
MSQSRLDRFGTRRTEINDRDIAGILTPLSIYRYQPTSFLAAWSGRSRKVINQRARLLKRRPNCYIAVAEHDHNFLYKEDFYYLDDNGYNALGISRDHAEPRAQHFNHRVMIDTAMASLDMGAKAAGARVLLPEELRTHPRFKADDPRHPFAFKVKIAHEFETGRDARETLYIPDAVRGYHVAAGYFFIKLEAETGENRIEPLSGGLRPTSFLKKFLCDQFIFSNELYKTQWGMPSLLTLVITPSQARVDRMKELILRLTAGRGSKHVLFHIYPTLKSRDEKVLPMPQLFTDAWQRAGYPEFSFTS